MQRSRRCSPISVKITSFLLCREHIKENILLSAVCSRRFRVTTHETAGRDILQGMLKMKSARNTTKFLYLYSQSMYLPYFVTE